MNDCNDGKKVRYLGLDGLWRDLKKMKLELSLWWDCSDLQRERLKRALTGDFKDIGHAYVDLIVHMHKLIHYTTGHIDAILWPGSIALAGYTLYGLVR